MNHVRASLSSALRTSPLLLLLPLTFVAAQGPSWQPIFKVPSARENHGLVFDTARGVVVLFGGANASSEPRLDTLWEWNGATWTQRIAAGPTPRYGHAMAYDSARQRVVVFGGNDGTQPVLDETWEWDGTAWSQPATPTRPPARIHTGMAFDSARGRTVLFGGWTPTGILGDTWEWNGNTWFASVNGPARSAHAMAYDPLTQRTLLFGGSNPATSQMDDLWAFDGLAWTQISFVTSPGIRHHHVMAYDASRQVMLLQGGCFTGGQLRDDSWIWDGTDWHQLLGAQVTRARAFSSLTYDAVRGRDFLFGGRDGATGTANESVLNDAWETDLACQNPSWSPVTGAGPAPDARIGPACVTDAALVVFGGTTPGAGGAAYLGDTWKFDGAGWTRLATAIAPSARVGTMTYDSVLQLTVLFGGETNGFTKLNDTWEYGATGWVQRTPPTTPPARAHHGTAFDTHRLVVVMFGGYGQNGVLGDMWEYDGTDWSQVFPSTVPPNRYTPGMAYDDVRRRIVLFGGSAGATNLQDTWEYDGANWHAISTAVDPGPLSQVSMTYVPERGCLLAGGYMLASGSAGSTVDATWIWSGTTWRNLGAAMPAPRRMHGLAYDAAGDRVLAFGGSDAASVPSANLYALPVAGLAAANVYGAGCSGSNGVPRATPANTPVLGDQFAIDGSNMPTTTLITIGFFGLAPTNPAIPLHFVGMPGCFGHVTPPPPGIIVGAPATAGGCRWSETVPLSPALIGLRLYFQALIPDQHAGNPLGATMTNAVWAQLGL